MLLIPATITVHLGAPDADAPNVTVPFPDYIKNTASCMLYPSWPNNALLANIYVLVSFALNRICTKWYRSQGLPFDITSSASFDQCYTYGRNLFDSISTLVDTHFTNYLTHNGSAEPLLARFCNRVSASCAGPSQWEQIHLSPLTLLQRYFGEDLALVSDAPVASEIGTYSPLQNDHRNDTIREIQLRLNLISAHYPGIPKIRIVDGIFNPDTENALKKFQQLFHLPSTGIVDKGTWYRLAYVYHSALLRCRCDCMRPRFAGAYTIPSTLLQPGDRGPIICLLQYYLSVLQCDYDVIPPLTLSGVFDDATSKAVKAFQSLSGLEADGFVRPALLQKLYDEFLLLSEAHSVPSYPGVRQPERMLLEGVAGEDVRQLQEILNTLSAVFPSIPATPVTGYFGSPTKDALIAAQTLCGLTPDGTIGVIDWDSIAERYDVFMRGTTRLCGQFLPLTGRSDA